MNITKENNQKEQEPRAETIKMQLQQLYSLFLEDSNYGPVYHGGKWDGISPIKMSRGALGTGAYFTPHKSIAEYYAKENNGTVKSAYLKISNPLIIKNDKNNHQHPCVVALTLLGMDKNKAAKMVEKIEEQKGYIGKEISSRAIPQGYDCIFLYYDDLREIVIWNSDKVIPI